MKQRDTPNNWGSLGNFATVPEEAFRCRHLRAETLKVLAVLMMYVKFDVADIDYLTCWPSLREMAETSKINKRTLTRGLTRLKKLGLVVVDAETKSRNGNGRSSVYSFRNFMSRLKELETVAVDDVIVASGPKSKGAATDGVPVREGEVSSEAD